MVTFDTQRWFVSKNRISTEKCLPIGFIETPTCHNMKQTDGHDFPIFSFHAMKYGELKVTAASVLKRVGEWRYSSMQ
jgi:hypothetical protein